MDLNPIEISVEESKKLLDSDPTTLLIDVREDHEREICSILPSIHIPMQSIPENLEKISKDQTLLVHCHHGMRSLNVVNYLREKGYKNAINMRGGIDQWTLQIDSSLTRY
jgi:adenylyltransferase/sulfurtransferase